jgi:RNA recognition motif-containing protein
MSKKLFVGNLDWGVTSQSLKSLFDEFGEISDAVVINDAQGRSKGFGFVTFVNDSDADTAVDAMNGKDNSGRPLTVNEARPRPDRAPRQY